MIKRNEWNSNTYLIILRNESLKLYLQTNEMHDALLQGLNGFSGKNKRVPINNSASNPKPADKNKFKCNHCILETILERKYVERWSNSYPVWNNDLIWRKAVAKYIILITTHLKRFKSLQSHFQSKNAGKNESSFLS